MNTGPVVVGERVRAAWKGCNYKGVLYEGVVAGINDDETFRITFDDGDDDASCPAKYITRDNGAPVPRVSVPSRGAGATSCLLLPACFLLPLHAALFSSCSFLTATARVLRLCLHIHSDQSSRSCSKAQEGGR